MFRYRTPTKFWEYNNAFFILPPTNFIRRSFFKLSTWPTFEWIILVAIIANCLQLASYEHLPNGDRGHLADVLDMTEPIFLLIFVLEMVIKIMANGFVLHKGSYLRSGWNIMVSVEIVLSFLSTNSTFSSTNNRVSHYSRIE